MNRSSGNARGKAYAKASKKHVITRLPRLVQSHPLVSFYAVLGLFLLAIILNNVLFRQAQKIATQAPLEAKKVQVYTIGSVPKLTIQAQVEKSGVIQVVALTNGVVSDIAHIEGDSVQRGDVLVSLATTYQGGNASSTQRQISQVQYKTAALKYEKQKEIIKKQIELAKKTDSNNDEVRKIAEQSVAETQDLISFNEELLKTLDQQIAATPTLELKQQKSGLIAAINQQRDALRNAQLQASSDKPPAEKSDLEREIAIKDLQLQEKVLLLTREIAGLQVALSRINEQLMFPAAPFRGVIQRVFVKEGQSVNPGTPLFALAQVAEDDPITAVAFVPQNVAQKVSFIEPSILHIGNTDYSVYPSFVSSEAVQGALFAIYYPIPENYNQSLTDKGYITVSVPIGYPDTGSVFPFIPLDSIYQTTDSSYVFVYQKGTVVTRTVELGQVYGSFVEVKSGLLNKDQIIVDRTVLEGEKVQVTP